MFLLISIYKHTIITTKPTNLKAISFKKASSLQNALMSFLKWFFLPALLLLSVYIWCRDEYLKRSVDVDLSRFEELMINRKTHFIFCSVMYSRYLSRLYAHFPSPINFTTSCFMLYFLYTKGDACLGISFTFCKVHQYH